MPKFKVVTKKNFKDLLNDKLKQQYERAQTLLEQYGETLSWDVANVLLHASDKGKIEEVLSELEKYWKKHLQSQGPEIRGTVPYKSGANKTKTMFLGICQDILQLPTA